jgi:hypothetical protein
MFSACTPKADIAPRGRHVRFVPKTEIGMRPTHVRFSLTRDIPRRGGYVSFAPTADVIKEAANCGGITFSKAASGLC